MGLDRFRRAHGNGRGAVARVEVPADELGPGVQATGTPEARGERRPDGRWLPGTRTAQSKGGRAIKSRTALSHDPRLAEVADLPGFEPYARHARAFEKAERARLAGAVGGGQIGAGPSLVVRLAALQSAASLFHFARGDFALGSKLANDATQNLVKAHALVAAEAKARPATQPLALAAVDALAEEYARAESSGEGPST